MMRYREEFKRKIILFICFIVLILIALNLLPRFLADDNILFQPEEYEYLVEIPAKGILARDEELYSAKSDGDIYKIAMEGERVRVGQPVVNVLTIEDTTDLKSELNRIENMIDFYSEFQLTEGMSFSNGEDIMETLVARLQERVLKEDYKNIFHTRESIELQMDSTSNLEEESTNENASLEDLIEKRNSLISKLSMYDKGLFSNHSGIVSYKLDGWESYLKPSNLSIVKIDDFKWNNLENNRIDEANKYLFKIIDGYKWYLLMYIDKVHNHDFEVGDLLDLNISDNNNHILSIRLPITNIFKKNNEHIYVLEANKYNEALYDKRRVDVKVVSFKDDVFKIPIESVIEKDGKIGVLVKEYYGVITFRQVDVIAEDERNAYVSKGDSNGEIESGDGSVRTISIFSEVIMKPSGVKIGEILN